MNKKWLIAILLVVGASVTAFILMRKNQTSPEMKSSAPATRSPVSEPMSAAQVPAHYEQIPGMNSLGPTLSPEKFAGKTREAYQAVRAIPETIAQMPCYCHCDRGMGHKSLHSCFEDDHAAHCVVCTDEALMAYQLQKQGLNPKQIRERIIAQYSQP